MEAYVAQIGAQIIKYCKKMVHAWSVNQTLKLMLLKEIVSESFILELYLHHQSANQMRFSQRIGQIVFPAHLDGWELITPAKKLYAIQMKIFRLTVFLVC